LEDEAAALAEADELGHIGGGHGKSLSFRGVSRGFGEVWEYRKYGLAPATETAEDGEEDLSGRHGVILAGKGGCVKALLFWALCGWIGVAAGLRRG
jgi:hypothetical protein